MHTGTSTKPVASLDQLEADIAHVVKLSGQHVHIDSEHLLTADDQEAEVLRGGVIIARAQNAVEVSWRARPAMGYAEGHSALSRCVALGRRFVREVLEVHAERHGWHIVPEHDRHTWSPVLVQWAARGVSAVSAAVPPHVSAPSGPAFLL